MCENKMAGKLPAIRINKEELVQESKPQNWGSNKCLEENESSGILEMVLMPFELVGIYEDSINAVKKKCGLYLEKEVDRSLALNKKTFQKHSSVLVVLLM